MSFTQFLQDLGKYVAYYPQLNHITGSACASILLYELIFWFNYTDDPDGVDKTEKDIREKLGLTGSELKNARKMLLKHGLTTEKRKGIPARLFIKPNLSEIDRKWAIYHSGETESAMSAEKKLRSEKYTKSGRVEGKFVSLNSGDSSFSESDDLTTMRVSAVDEIARIQKTSPSESEQPAHRNPISQYAGNRETGLPETGEHSIYKNIYKTSNNVCIDGKTETADTHTEILDADFWEPKQTAARQPIELVDAEIVEEVQQPQSDSQQAPTQSLRCQSDQKVSAEAIIPHETKVPPRSHFSEQGINPIEVLRQIEPDRSSFEYRNLPSVVKQELQFGKARFYPWNKDGDTLRLFMAFLVNGMGSRMAESERKSIVACWIRKANGCVPQMSKRDYSVVMSKWAEFIENAQTATNAKEVQGKKRTRAQELLGIYPA